MKILIFSVLVLVCIQFCSANLHCSCNKPNNCAAQFDQLNANAKAFINGFKQLHDATHEISDTAFDLCLTLFQTEYRFLGGDYATDLLHARCELRTFFVNTAALGVQFFNFFASIKNNYNRLIEMVEAFRRSNNLTCHSRAIGTECEVKLSARRCELDGFLKEVIAMLRKGVQYMTKVQAGQEDLGGLIDDFTSNNDITCGGGEGNYCQYRDAVNEFFVAFNGIHWKNIHLHYIDFQFKMDMITARTSTLFEKYNCL